MEASGGEWRRVDIVGFFRVPPLESKACSAVDGLLDLGVNEQ